MVMYIHAANVIITIAKIAILLFETRLLKHTKVNYATAKVFTLQLTVTVLLTLATALFYTYNGLENMTFVEALYFTFTSLTTIGFGDFKLDFRLYFTKSKAHLFVILCLLWFFGMGMVASIIAGLSEMVAKHKFGNIAKFMKWKPILCCCCNTFKVDGNGRSCTPQNEAKGGDQTSEESCPYQNGGALNYDGDQTKEHDIYSNKHDKISNRHDPQNNRIDKNGCGCDGHENKAVQIEDENCDDVIEFGQGKTVFTNHHVQ